MQKPIVDMSRHWLAPRPSKNYIFHLLHHHIQTVNPARSLDAGVGELRNFWMFPGRYVGITHNRITYLQGMARLTVPQPQPDICTPLLTDPSQYPTVFQMRLESDFSFLEDFDMVVCTQTIFYVEDRLDVLRRLSQRVKRGGSLIVDDHVESAADFVAAVEADYEDVQIVYHGFENCGATFKKMPKLRNMVPEPQFMELCYREMTAPNRPEGHTSFYMIARNKKADAAPPGPTPELVYDKGLFVVRKDAPFLKMEEVGPNAMKVAFKSGLGAAPVKAEPVKVKPIAVKPVAVKPRRPALHIGPPKTASTTVQEFIIPHLGRPYLIKPEWGKLLTRVVDFQQPPLASDIILSDEEFGRFLFNTPGAIAARLATVVPDATVIYVRRDARDLFRSFYRQSLVNNLTKIAAIHEAGLPIKPLSPDEYFDLALATYRERLIGVFAMANWAKVRNAFAKHFAFTVLDYAQLRKSPQDFAAAFADACGCPTPTIDVGKANLSTPERIEDAIAAVTIPIDPQVLDLYRSYYVDYRLSPDRQESIASLN
jgi:hypothetical protein